MFTLYDVPQDGDEYLVAFKLHGGISVGITGIWNSNITGFDFTDASNPYLFPKNAYN